MSEEEVVGIPAFTLVKIKDKSYRETASEIYKTASDYIFGIYHTTGEHDLVIAWSEKLDTNTYADLIDRIESMDGVDDTITGVTMTLEPKGIVSTRLPLGIKPEEAVIIQQMTPKIETYLKEYFQKHTKVKSIYPSDVAEKFNLEYDIILQIFNKLVSEKKLQPIGS